MDINPIPRDFDKEKAKSAALKDTETNEFLDSIIRPGWEKRKPLIKAYYHAWQAACEIFGQGREEANEALRLMVKHGAKSHMLKGNMTKLNPYASGSIRPNKTPMVVATIDVNGGDEKKTNLKVSEFQPQTPMSQQEPQQPELSGEVVVDGENAEQIETKRRGRKPKNEA